MDRLTLVKRVIGVGSVLLGVTALISPRRLAGFAGIHDKNAPEALAAFGAKELAAGAALLAPVKSGPFLWARLAGDIMDMGGLVAAARRPGSHKRLLTVLGVAVVAMTALDLYTAAQATRANR
jgi:hypothetical protein